MTSQPERRSKVARRAVLGTALGGAAAAALPGTAHAAPVVRAPSVQPWKLRNTMAGDSAWQKFLRGQDLL